MPDTISIEGPVGVIDGQLTLRIPLWAGGEALAQVAQGIGQIDGDYLYVIIKPWLAEKLRIGVGSLVIVDNANGKFTISRKDSGRKNTDGRGPDELISDRTLELRRRYSR